MARDLPIQAELSSDDQGLGNEKPMLTAPGRASPDLLPHVACRGVGVEARLLLSRLARADFGSRLR
jgi:hypothetical protein